MQQNPETGAFQRHSILGRCRSSADAPCLLAGKGYNTGSNNINEKILRALNLTERTGP